MGWGETIRSTLKNTEELMVKDLNDCLYLNLFSFIAIQKQ